jgi:phytoene dehydrogenase-like protein
MAPDPADEYDGIVVGAGHNGLILQAYLCRAGLRVLALERLARAGGPLVTEPDACLAGVRHNTHAVFLRGVSALPWFRDLELPRHGIEMIHPDPNVAQVTTDGRVLAVHGDVERTCASLAEVSPADAAAYRRLHDEFRPILEEIVGPEHRSPPLAAAERRRLLERSRLGRRALEVEPLSARGFVEAHFEHPAVRAGLLYICIIREFDVLAPGLGLLVPSIVASDRKAELCRGGSACLADALVADVEEHGGLIVTGAQVTRILVDRGRAAAVELAGGRHIRARHFVAAALNPHQVLELLGPQHLPVDVVEHARRYRYNVVGPLFGVNVALREAPRYRAADRHPELARAGLTILGLDAPDEIYELYAGRLPALGSLWGTVPTAHDRSQAPAGVETGFVWQKVPYALEGDPRKWDARKVDHARDVLARWRRYAPNLTDDNVLSMSALSPLDTERRFPNLRGGDLGVGWAGAPQALDRRPFPGAGRYRWPLPGLYLCGGATHPGGNITGLPGYNAARVVAEDVGVPLWWNPEDLAARWSALA